MRVPTTILVSILAVPAAAQLQREHDDLYTRVVDTGSGLCTVTAFPDGYYMVYDAGYWRGGALH